MRTRVTTESLLVQASAAVADSEPALALNLLNAARGFAWCSQCQMSTPTEKQFRNGEIDNCAICGGEVILQDSVE